MLFVHTIAMLSRSLGASRQRGQDAGPGPWCASLLVLLMCVSTVATPAFAQANATLPPAAQPSADPAADDASPVDAPVALQPPALAPMPSAPGVAWEPWQSSTVGWQVLGGVGCAAVLGIGGGLAIAATNNGGSDGWVSLGLFILGATVGATVGSGLGVAIVGDLDGGNGSYFWSITAGIVGTIAGGAIGSAVDSSGDGLGLQIGAILGGTGGGITGYHLSASPVPMQASLLTRSGDGLAFGIPAVQPRYGVGGNVVGATVRVLGFGW